MGQLAYLRMEITNAPRCPLAKLVRPSYPSLHLTTDQPTALLRYPHVALGTLLLFGPQGHPEPQINQREVDSGLAEGSRLSCT